MRPKLIIPTLLTLFIALNVVCIAPAFGVQIVIDVHSPGEGALVISPDPAVGTAGDTLLWVIHPDLIQYSLFASHVGITVSTDPASGKNPWGGANNVTSPKLALHPLHSIAWGEELGATNTCGTFRNVVKVYYEIDPELFLLLGEKTGTLKLPCQVGGIWVPVDKFSLLAPYITLASTILVATAATAIYVKRRKKKE